MEKGETRKENTLEKTSPSQSSGNIDQKGEAPEGRVKEFLE